MVTATVTQQCQQKHISVRMAVCYCFCASLVFVLSLYALVPKHIRDLRRDDPRHIKRRMIAVLIVCFSLTFTFPRIFCNGSSSSGSSSGSRTSTALDIMGWSFQNLVGPLLHSMMLYLGPIVVVLCKIRILCIRKGEPRGYGYKEAIYSVVIGPFFPINTAARWVQIRNLIVGPLSEEVVFRGCMMPPLLAAGIHPTTAVFVAPLFFGTAHVHHAYLVRQQGASWAYVLAITTFQFTYTSLFGAYVSYAFLRTGSVLAVTLSHAFCNGMGLPNFMFLISPKSSFSLYPYRWIIILSHILGAFLFAKEFQISYLLTERSTVLDFAPA